MLCTLQWCIDCPGRLQPDSSMALQQAGPASCSWQLASPRVGCLS